MEVRFTYFDVEEGSKSCPYDHLTITDGDGTIVMNKTCGRANGNPDYGNNGYGYGYGNNSYGYGNNGYGYGYGNNSSQGIGNFSAGNGYGNGYAGNNSRSQADFGSGEYGNGFGNQRQAGSVYGNVSEISKDNILNITITSNTNVLIFTFVTDYSVTRRGWSANWRSITPGLYF